MTYLDASPLQVLPGLREKETGYVFESPFFVFTKTYPLSTPSGTCTAIEVSLQLSTRRFADSILMKLPGSSVSSTEIDGTFGKKIAAFSSGSPK